MTPGDHLIDLAQRTEAGTEEDVNQLEDTTTPDEMYEGVIGRRAPGGTVPDTETGE